MKVGDLLLGLGVDSVDFKSAVTKEADEAGKAGASTLSKSMATGLKVGAVLVGGAFALMTKGALEMETAQGKFQAATGKSREEAIAFTKDMNGLVGSAATVGMSFEEIAELGTMVEQQFGTSGEATKDLTEDIAAFSKVTGQDATQAAADLEDMLSAYGLSADDATGAMDLLVASNQKFGTSAGPDSLAVLNDMAPALTAMGMGLDDGVELLNAFEVAGIDAGAAQGALKKAIGELKPGENIDTLIAKIGAIEDPLLRSQAAAEIFGKKAGPQMAALIKPGMTSLDDFGVSADEAAGTVDQAASDMMTTSEKFKAFGEKIGGFLRGAGQEFGPLVTSIGTVGPLIAGALAKSWGSIKDSRLVQAAAGIAGGAASAAYSLGMKAVEAISGAVSAAWAALGSPGSSLLTAARGAGTLAGGAFSTAFGAAALIGIPLAAGLAMKAIGDEANKQNIPSQIWDFIFGAGSDLQAKAAQYTREVDRALAEGLTLEEAKKRGQDWLASMYGPEAAARFIPQIEALATQAGDAGGAKLGESFTRALTASDMSELVPHFQHVGAGAADATGQGFVDNKAHLADDARETLIFAMRGMEVEAAGAKRVGDALADGLLEGIPNIRDAWRQYLQETKKALDPMEQITWLEARLAGDKLAEGLASKNPLTRRRAEIMRDDMMAQLDDLQQLMGIEGTQGSRSLANNLDGGPAAAQARAIMQRLEAIFSRQFTVGVGVKAGVGGKKAKGEHVGGGGMAAGGRFRAGWRGWVGEEGPEWAEFDHPGYIVPNHELHRIPGAAGGSEGGRGGSAGTQVHLHIGTLIADESGLAELGRRIEHAAGFSQRSRSPIGGAF